MNYHPDDFIALVQQVEAEGGYIPHELCEGRTYRIKQPDPDHGGIAYRTIRTTHCGHAAKLGVKYDVGDAETHFAEVCAVDDAVGLWPRYAHLMTDRSFETPGGELP